LIKKAALAVIGLFSPIALLTLFFSQTEAQIIFALLAMAFPVALIVLGASQKGRLGPLGLPLLALLLLQEGSVIAMIVFRDNVLNGPWVGGLPLTAAIQIYVLWLLPLLLVALAYGLTFDGFSLKEEDLARLERYTDNRSSQKEEP